MHTTATIVTFFYKLLTLSHAFLPVTVAKLSALKTVRVFGPLCTANLRSVNENVRRKLNEQVTVTADRPARRAAPLPLFSVRR